MGANDRTVQHLRLRSLSAQAAVHAAHRLEDALRCASLPDAGERVLLVRRLHLGRLPEGLSAQSLSLLIEQRVAAVGGEWVHGDDARAGLSNTVFFASRLQLVQTALRWRALGVALAAWYWPLALPGVAVRAPAPDFLAQLLAMVDHWPEASAALPNLLDGMLVERQGGEWHAQLSPLWRERLAPWNQPWQEGASIAPRPRPAALHAESPSAPHQTLQPPVARAQTLASVHPEPNAPTRAPTHALPEALPHAPTLPHPLQAPSAAPRQKSAPQARKQDRRGQPSKNLPAKHTSPPSSPLPVAPPAQEAAAPVHAATGRTTESPASIDRFEPWAEAVATEAGGLLFVWPLLERQGAAAWDALHPTSCLAQRVLSLALQRLRVPAHDPAWALCASLPQAGEAPLPCDELAEQWLRACRRHARRELRIGLASLIVRPGWLRWSSTHIDVHFRLQDADLRVRRAALDTDPGWVDALQRVVGFHYDHPGHHPSHRRGPHP